MFQLRRSNVLGFRNGDEVVGKVRPPRQNVANDRYGMLYIDSVNGKSPEEAKGSTAFPSING